MHKTTPILFLLLGACLDGETDTGTDEATLTHPPDPGPEATPDGDGVVTLAITKFYFGDTLRDGTPAVGSGWKSFGYDIDGKASTTTSSDLCKPRENASEGQVYPDGDGGIDNSFGKNIVGIYLAFAPAFADETNAAYAAGGPTLLLSMKALGTSSNYNPMTTSLYRGLSLGSTPAYDGTDLWPVDPASLLDVEDPTSARMVFPASYVTDDVWVSGPRGDFVIHSAIEFFLWPRDVVISHAVITAELAPDRKSAHGTISGVISTDPFTSEVRKAAALYDVSLCSGPVIESIVTQIDQASDILGDGSQDPSKVCDGISIGIGFDAVVVQLGDVGEAEPIPDWPCDD